MKKSILFSFFLGLLLSACSKRIEKEVTDPLSGKLYEKYEYIETDDGSFKKDGYYKKWYSNGQIHLTGFYENNLKTAEWKVYYEDGTVQEVASYLIDTLHGKRESFYKNGKLKFSAEYVKGEKQGLVKEYFENGQLEKEYNCVNGLKDGKFASYNKEGQKIIDAGYINGKLNGEFHKWYENGKDQEISFYKNDVLDGKFLSFYETGNSKETGQYNAGKKDGGWKTFSKMKSSCFHESYENGENISLVGEWKVNDSYKIKYFKDGSALMINENGKESKSNYSIYDRLLSFRNDKESDYPINRMLSFGNSSYSIIEMTPDSYKIKETSMWGKSTIYEGVKIN